MPAVRFRIPEKDSRSTGTLAGVPYHIMRSLMDAACINHHDDLKMRKHKSLCVCEECAYNRTMISHAKRIDEAIQQAMRMTFPHNKNPQKPTKAQRLKAVMDQRKEREWLESFMNDLQEKAAAKKRSES